MRGFKRDNTMTELAREGFTSSLPLLLDRRSFISLPKDGKAHLILYGRDVEWARKRAIERATDYQGMMRCQCGECGGMTISDAVSEMSPIKAHMAHLKYKPWERCWCDENVAMWARICHAREHKDGRLG